MSNYYGEDLLELAIIELIRSEPFFANLLMEMTRNYTTDIPTLGVSVTDNVNLHVNPFFWKSLSLKEQIEVLKHEALHVICNHFSRFKDLEPAIFEKSDKMIDKLKNMFNASTLNQAADFAINEYLPNMPKEIKCFDEKGFPVVNPSGKKGEYLTGKPLLVKDLKAQFKDVRYRENMEYYYEFLKQNLPKQEIKISEKGMTIDDHSLWHTGEEDSEAIKEKVKAVVNKAVEKSGGREAGNLPEHIEQLIDSLNYIPKDWRSDIQRFVARTMEILIESNRKIRNRRYGYLYPGYKIYPKLHIFVGVDCSGSISDEELCQFFSEINKMHKMGIKITVAECDTQINRLYEYNPKEKVKVTGRGGTYFSPVFQEAKNQDIDGLIYLTDGENFGEELTEPKFPVLWALLPNCKVNYDWGFKTKVEIKKR